MMTVSNVVNATLLGLESESAVETNLHQEIHTLTNEQVHALVEDINLRIFKDARRRLEEQIIEEEPWDEEELGPKTQANEKLLSDAELDALAEKEEKEGWKPPEEEEPASVAASSATPLAIPLETSGGAISAIKPAEPSIALEKLTAPVQTKTEVTEVRPQQTGIQSVVIPKPEEKPAAAVPATPPPTIAPSAHVPQTPPAPGTYKGTDPYREAPE
jgi:hypothetical protein